MTDPRRSDTPPSAAGVPGRERDAHVEELLLSGLDHYFAGHYELAISVWTRVLFLNHGHARARAYIERARSAIAERQRESEELLHSGVDAFVRGDAASARRLLTSAVERGTASEEALAVLDRLNRLEVAMGPQELSADPAGQVDLRPMRAAPPKLAPERSRVKWMVIGVAAGVLTAVGAGWLWTRSDWRSVETPTPGVVTAEPDEVLPVPTPSEAALARARALYAHGYARDALTALDGLRHGDPLAAEANALREKIQRELLATAGRLDAGGPTPTLRGGAEPGAQAAPGEQRSQAPRQ
jgi:hypothetical protein